MPLRTLTDPDHLPALDRRYAIDRPALGLGAGDPPPRFLLLYGSLRERSYYGRVRNADIAAHIIGFVRQAALGDPLVAYETRVQNGVDRILAARTWTPNQKRWLTRIGRALKEQPVGDPAMLSDPLFAQNGGFEVVDREFDHRLGDVLMDLNAAIWDSPKAA